MQSTEKITLNNGVAMPAFGLGVYRSGPDETVEAVKTAIDHGYRLIDTAAIYGNEKEVGEGVRGSTVPRNGVFVTTKLWIKDFGYDQALRAFDTSQEKLGLGYVDLYLLHWPVPKSFEATIASYKAAERLLDEGRVKAIGVCNFNPQHLDDLIAETEVVPAVNQIELHPFFTQQAVVEANQRLGIVTQAWSPIGGVNRYWSDNPDPAKDPLTHPVIVELAERYNKTPAQVILRWQLDHGYSAIPKSANPGRIKENFAIFDFALTEDEIAAIDALHTNQRGGPDPDEFGEVAGE
ncbi:aldo/keto reductase [Aeoliella mucimassa]|uniref:Morphine 6-dehydrogenase n=1 Tax=Aeoliella mucimassa TaxID=2527972 RepID=A0A518AQC4_9BACT|nr:aldo/keto reductase [Aeoliella mucimassa]QDU56922.1 Morphine 6-dehydrogenase [Aeoliella mucimassa]